MDLMEILRHVPAASCDYQEWVNVGMALKSEGYSVTDWDSWSRADARYHAGECVKKWATFNGSDTPVTGGTIIQMAKDRGFVFASSSDYGNELLDWEDVINDDTQVGEPLPPQKYHDRVEELTAFLNAVFDEDDHVGYVTQVYENGDKLSPTKGCYDRTAKQLCDALRKCSGDIGKVFGDANPDAGAWVRVNPLDGKGVADANVTDYRYVLVESDSLPLERQNALIRELELPVAALTYTGGKSVHAICHIDAPDRETYRKRVAYLFEFCRKNGLEIDKSCKNPSRLSRLPAFQRGSKWQYLIDTNIGHSSYDEWHDWAESLTDDLPDFTSLDLANIPALKPPLIDGVLRMGHKMLLVGPSKAGKSFALIELAICIAHGLSWMGFGCRKGKVLYINLELDDASCMNRFAEVYKRLGVDKEPTSNLSIWNLRGRCVPMDKLAPKLIRRAVKQNYAAIIIDPIYKVITGDENSADQMAYFCNQFDTIAAECGCAVIYCHHHSKGVQGNKKSMDRASGSGVFARDPDAMLDMIELPVSEQLRKTEADREACKVCVGWLQRFLGDKYREYVSQDDECSKPRMMSLCNDSMPRNAIELMLKDIEASNQRVGKRTAWRIDGTLREFPRFEPVNVWFDYPVHTADAMNTLKDVDPNETWQNNFKNKKTNEQRQEERQNNIEIVFENCVDENGTAKLSDMVRTGGKSKDTTKRHIEEHGGFWVANGIVGRKKDSSEENS